MKVIVASLARNVQRQMRVSREPGDDEDNGLPMAMSDFFS
jgi:hypothetical protein